MKNKMSLVELTEACIKAFIPGATVEDVAKEYNIAVIDGKSVLKRDEEVNHKRRTFGFYWHRKVC